MNIDNFADHPHRRFNPLKGEWVLVSPHRNKRPWLGQVEENTHDDLPSYDATCYLCPGNSRINGDINPDYTGPFVFPNDFPALIENNVNSQESADPLFSAQHARGLARVICYSENHDLTMAQLDVSDIRKIVDVWQAQFYELSAEFECVSIFENKGAQMGCSNPHPHGQIWATDFVPNELHREDQTQLDYFSKHRQLMLIDYVEKEIALKDRLICKNSSWAAIVPYWASWPFETILLPRRHMKTMTEITAYEKNDLADILKAITTAYDRLFKTSFPYSMGWHNAPSRGEPCDHWQLHAHFYPPLLRSATVRKFMVGFELLAETQRDMTPETAAQHLREVCVEC